jgi:V/A-type H+-transporting ATPase subunit C
MSGFEYGNARLRAMKSRLLRNEQLYELAALESINRFLELLRLTAYEEAIEAALVQASGAEALRNALQNDLAHLVRKGRDFFSGAAAEQADWFLRRYDVSNLKAILRGAAQQLADEAIIPALLPPGEPTLHELRALPRDSDARSVVDLLATCPPPPAHPPLPLRARGDGLNLPQMEVALERWYFESALAFARKHSPTLQETLMFAADRANILTALRLVGLEPPPLLQEHFGAEDPALLFIGPGHIARQRLVTAGRQESVEEAVQALSSTPYASVLEAALQQYEVTGKASAFERALEEEQLRRASKLFVLDALGIGVFIGYVVLKTREVANLRWIAHGIQFGEAPGVIRDGLLL